MRRVRRSGGTGWSTSARLAAMAPSQQGQSGDAGSLALRRLATPHLVRLLGEWRSGGTAYPALAAALRALIVEGRLPPQTRVPSERALAAALGVSRNTATAALDVLRAEGYLASRRGTGSWVTLPAGDEDRPDEPARRGGRDSAPARRGRHRPHGREPARAARPRRARGRGGRRPAARARRPRLRALRPGGPARGRRRAPERPRAADRAGPGADHPGRAARLRSRAAHARAPRRPRARRDADLSERARRDPRARLRAGRRPGRPRGLGPRLHGLRPARRAAAARLPDPRLPEPDRRSAHPRSRAARWPARRVPRA